MGMDVLAAVIVLLILEFFLVLYHKCMDGILSRRTKLILVTYLSSAASFHSRENTEEKKTQN